jgi:hypothetical protein
VLKLLVTYGSQNSRPKFSLEAKATLILKMIIPTKWYLRKLVVTKKEIKT